MFRTTKCSSSGKVVHAVLCYYLRITINSLVVVDIDQIATRFWEHS